MEEAYQLQFHGRYSVGSIGGGAKLVFLFVCVALHCRTIPCRYQLWVWWYRYKYREGVREGSAVHRELVTEYDAIRYIASRQGGVEMR